LSTLGKDAAWRSLAITQRVDRCRRDLRATDSISITRVSEDSNDPRVQSFREKFQRSKILARSSPAVLLLRDYILDQELEGGFTRYGCRALLNDEAAYQCVGGGAIRSIPIHPASGKAFTRRFGEGTRPSPLWADCATNLGDLLGVLRRWTDGDAVAPALLAAKTKGAYPCNGGTAGRCVHSCSDATLCPKLLGPLTQQRLATPIGPYRASSPTGQRSTPFRAGVDEPLCGRVSGSWESARVQSGCSRILLTATSPATSIAGELTFAPLRKGKDGQSVIGPRYRKTRRSKPA